MEIYLKTAKKAAKILEQALNADVSCDVVNDSSLTKPYAIVFDINGKYFSLVRSRFEKALLSERNRPAKDIASEIARHYIEQEINNAAY